MRIKVPFHKQKTIYNCGPAALQIIFNYFGISITQTELEKKLETDPTNGTSHQKIIEVAREYGLFCYVNNDSSLKEVYYFLQQRLPAIVNFIEPSNDESHYAVIIGINKQSVLLNDPWNGKNFKIKKKEFDKRWHNEEGTNKRWIIVFAKEDFALGKQYLPK